MLQKPLVHFLILAFLLMPGFSAWSTRSSQDVPHPTPAPQTANLQNPVYLPAIFKPAPHLILLGIIPSGYFGPDANGQASLDRLVKAADNWANKKHSLVGIFIDLQDVNPEINFQGQLETLWKNGYTPFVNLNSTKTASQIASGSIDQNIHNMAEAYAAWANQGAGRKAFLAPLQEMNGYWTSYGKDPANFKIAYSRIRQIFIDEGAPASSIWWTFAPNGWSQPGHEFENYYPGSNKVDAVSFSSYNYGFCSVAIPWQKWESAFELYDTYINRIRLMAPGKPIIVSQTGSTAQSPSTGHYDRSRKNSWIEETYNYLAGQYNVLAVMYYDMDLSWECDWAIFNTGQPFESYPTAAANSAFTYMSPRELSETSLFTGQ
jgi:hypothetical protein